jgi:dynein light intermediate chain 2
MAHVWSLISKDSDDDDGVGFFGSAKEGGGTPGAGCAVRLVEQRETYALFVGQKQAGKSTVITAFHNPSKDDVPKPTVALEYLFARRSSGSNQPKDVAHIWELGGGLRLSNLVCVPLTSLTVSKAVVTVVVDLSQPQNLLNNISQWLHILRARAEASISELRASDPSAADIIDRAVSARYRADHPDRAVVRPLPISTSIVATKLDVLRDQDQIQKKVACQMLRFVAHQYGASLLTFSAKDKMSQNNLRAHLTSQLFGSSNTKNSKKEAGSEKPMLVPAGSDTFEEIFKSGVPAARNFSTSKGDFIDPRTGGAAANALTTWGRVLEEFFGAATPGEDDVVMAHDGIDIGHAASSSEYSEPFVDEARVARDEELLLYKKEALRRARVEQSSARKSSSSSHSRRK